MAKSLKRTAAPEPPTMPRIGDKVTIPPSESVRVITSVGKDGTEVNVESPGTNLEWFRVKVEDLNFVERRVPAKTSNPFTTPEPTFDFAEILAKVESVRDENLKRSDDDIDILKAYLKTQAVPRGAIIALETLAVEQHKSWKAAMKRIEESLE
jgi:hypothetical protein